MTSSFLLLARYIQLLEVEQQVVGVQEHLVGRGRDRVGDLPCSFNLPQGKEGRVVRDGLTNQLRTLSLSLYTTETQKQIVFQSKVQLNTITSTAILVQYRNKICIVLFTASSAA